VRRRRFRRNGSTPTSATLTSQRSVNLTCSSQIRPGQSIKRCARFQGEKALSDDPSGTDAFLIPPLLCLKQLPYGTLTDDEMMRMPVGAMQDEGGLLFLWVTGRAMELGRECLKAWG
jgi:hypothetical protein